MSYLCLFLCVKPVNSRVKSWQRQVLYPLGGEALPLQIIIISVNSEVIMFPNKTNLETDTWLRDSSYSKCNASKAKPCEFRSNNVFTHDIKSSRA